jgi:2-amino-4-hydroxy-6-hydroxymethyldihydropteridine diphosphokinase
MKQDVMNVVFLCLGGNLGDRLNNFNKARILISQGIGEITKQSLVYETEAWGTESGNKYLNQVIKIKTAYSAQKLIGKLLKVEEKLGRVRTSNKNDDRIIDIDILFFNNEVISEEGLEIPHPRLHQRNFVLKPLSEIAPGYVHPVLRKKVGELLKRSTDKLQAIKYTKPKYICIEGNIGSGKTTLAIELSKKFKADFLPEEFEKNDLLPLFYADKKTFAFPLEYSFLLSRYQHITDHFKKDPSYTISDYSIYKCLWFAKVNLRPEDYTFFKKHFNAIEEQLPKPDLIIYLHSSVENLRKNINARGRHYEKNIKSSYLDSYSR